MEHLTKYLEIKNRVERHLKTVEKIIEIETKAKKKDKKQFELASKIELAKIEQTLHNAYQWFIVDTGTTLEG